MHGALYACMRNALCVHGWNAAAEGLCLPCLHTLAVTALKTMSRAEPRATGTHGRTGINPSYMHANRSMQVDPATPWLAATKTTAAFQLSLHAGTDPCVPCSK